MQSGANTESHLLKLSLGRLNQIHSSAILPSVISKLNEPNWSTSLIDIYDN